MLVGSSTYLLHNHLSLNQELLSYRVHLIALFLFKSKINRPKSGCYFSTSQGSSNGYQPRSLNLAFGEGDGLSAFLLVAEAWGGGEGSLPEVFLAARAWGGGDGGLSRVLLPA